MLLKSKNSEAACLRCIYISFFFQVLQTSNNPEKDHSSFCLALFTRFYFLLQSVRHVLFALQDTIDPSLQIVWSGLISN